MVVSFFRNRLRPWLMVASCVAVALAVGRAVATDTDIRNSLARLGVPDAVEQAGQDPATEDRRPAAIAPAQGHAVVFPEPQAEKAAESSHADGDLAVDSPAPPVDQSVPLAPTSVRPAGFNERMPSLDSELTPQFDPIEVQEPAELIPTPPADFDEGLPASDDVLVPQDPREIREQYDRVLDLEPSGQNRRVIERVRDVAETELGVDTTAEDWVHVKDHSRITWGGRIQGDWVNWASDRQFGGQPNYVEFRRLRLFAEGEGYGVYDYKLQLEFAPLVDREVEVIDNYVDLDGIGVEVKDAYVGIRDIPRFGRIRFGHFKVPIGLEELTSSKFTTFMERALPTRFLPGREMGVAARNYSFDENMTWAFGLFFDDLSESSHGIEDDNQGLRLVGRATLTPRYVVLSDGCFLIHTGLGYAYTRPRRRNDPSNPGSIFRPVRFDARPEIHRGDDLIDTGEINTQQYQTVNAELAVVRGPASVQSEVTWTNIDELGGGSTDLYGAYIQASWFLTGEHRAYNRTSGTFGRVTPHENFWMVETPGGRRSGRGAWELAARWSYLNFSNANRQKLNDLTVGCNWYWNPRARMMFNWIHPFARYSEASPSRNAQGDILAMRLQVDF